MKNNKDREVLLSVRHLCQYFKTGRKDFKAVDDVSFDVYKGEVFGLVGESGCGKTTTGRSIIKIYNITSGDIIFKGVRIGAGIRSYQNEITALKNELKENNKKIKTLVDEKEKESLSIRNEEINKRIVSLKDEIVKAEHDQKNCDKDFARLKCQELKEKYDNLLKDEKDEEKIKEWERNHDTIEI